MRKSILIKYLKLLFVSLFVAANMANATGLDVTSAQSKMNGVRNYYQKQIRSLRGLQSFGAFHKKMADGDTSTTQDEPSPYELSVDLDLPNYIFFDIDSHGNFYLSSLRHGGVEKYSKHGDYMATLPVTMPLSVFVDKEDNIYAYDLASTMLQKFDFHGNQRDSIVLWDPSAEFNLPIKLQMNSKQEINALTFPLATILDAPDDEPFPPVKINISRFNKYGEFLNNIVSYQLATEVNEFNNVATVTGAITFGFGILADDTVATNSIDFNKYQSNMEFYSQEGDLLKSMPTATREGGFVLTALEDKVLAFTVIKDAIYITQYTKDGGYIGLFSHIPFRHDFPISATVDKHGNVYVLTLDEYANSKAIEKFSASGKYLGPVLDLKRQCPC